MVVKDYDLDWCFDGSFVGDKPFSHQINNGVKSQVLEQAWAN